MPSVDIHILGQKYTVKGDASEERIRELSRYIDDKIQEVCGKYPNITPLKALILTTFTIAEELHNLQSEQAAITKDIEQKAQLLAGILD